MSTQSLSSLQFSYPYGYGGGGYFPVPFHLQHHHHHAYVAPPAGGGVYSLPQYQAQQLFQKDAQIITLEALESVKAAIASCDIEKKAKTEKKAVPRKAAGQTWMDPTLAEWPENDFRLFCGDLGNEVNDDILRKAFLRYPSFNMARIIM